VRIEGPIPGRSAVGIEVPNQKTSLVHIKEILSAEEYQRAAGPLVVALGKDIAGHPIVADLTDMPHLLIAGATGSGKSVMLNAIIASLLFRCTPLDLRLLLIDPKRVEFAHYAQIPHLLAPVVTNPRAAAGALREMLREMEERFERFAASGTRNIQTYNQIPGGQRLPYIVIVVDELADLMMVAPADFEDVICRLAQMTRATGIHLVVATQRPSVDVITGLIKANIPSRVAFAVSSQVDSRTILDAPGAEKLLGKGDMLFLPIGAARPTRAQGAFIADSEIQALVAWWKAQGRPVFDQDLLAAEQATDAADAEGDALLVEAARLVVRAGYGSVSLLQRKMKIGYVRAARLVDQLEERGIVGPAQGSNPREVLVGLDELDRLLKRG
jgi:S-DNA-T family DNA segregation ATPase FtsK/SpoIIIE